MNSSARTQAPDSGCRSTRFLMVNSAAIGSPYRSYHNAVTRSFCASDSVIRVIRARAPIRSASAGWEAVELTRDHRPNLRLEQADRVELGALEGREVGVDQSAAGKVEG